METQWMEAKLEELNWIWTWTWETVPVTVGC
jgi:hypothetical protein